MIRRGEATYKRVYEGELRAQLEATAFGQHCALNIDTGEYVLATTAEGALQRFRARFAEGFPYLIRIGMPRLVA